MLYIYIYIYGDRASLGREPCSTHHREPDRGSTRTVPPQRDYPPALTPGDATPIEMTLDTERECHVGGHNLVLNVLLHSVFLGSMRVHISRDVED